MKHAEEEVAWPCGGARSSVEAVSGLGMPWGLEEALTLFELPLGNVVMLVDLLSFA